MEQRYELKKLDNFWNSLTSWGLIAFVYCFLLEDGQRQRTFTLPPRSPALRLPPSSLQRGMGAAVRVQRTAPARRVFLRPQQFTQAILRTFLPEREGHGE